MPYATKSTSIAKIALLSVAIAAALVVLAARPSTAAVTTNVTYPVTGTLYNPCNGHLLSLNQTFHLLASTTFDASGFQTGIHVNEENSRDTDLTTGFQCTDTGTVEASGLNYDVSTGGSNGLLPVVVAATLLGTTNCPGSEGNALFKIGVHVTINPDGTTTANFDNLEVTCN